MVAVMPDLTHILISVVAENVSDKECLQRDVAV